MSHDLTPSELEALSRWMVAHGEMSYEEFCTELERQQTKQQESRNRPTNPT